MNKKLKGMAKYIYYKLFIENKDAFNDREPWVCKPAREFIKNNAGRQTRVLEFGGGGSTLFFSDNCKEVNTIESNKAWVKKIKSKLRKENVLFVDEPNGEYDLILVDSSGNRLKEFELAKKHLKEEGIIIFDNIDRYDLVGKADYVFRGYSKNLAGLTTTGVFVNV